MKPFPQITEMLVGHNFILTTTIAHELKHARNNRGSKTKHWRVSFSVVREGDETLCLCFATAGSFDPWLIAPFPQEGVDYSVNVKNLSGS